MSDWKENFFRNEEESLDYDDSAFYYFAISLLTVILLPVTIYMLSRMCLGEKKISINGKNCECSHCKQLYKKRKQMLRGSWIRCGFFMQVLILLFFWYLLYLTAAKISQIEPIKSFDPYSILGLDPGAEVSVIKKTFRRLSVRYHPDKNPDDPLAAQKFIQLSKAYNVSSSFVYVSDPHRRDSEGKLGEIRQPRRTWLLPRGNCLA